MFARNLFAAILVVTLASMTISCFTADSSNMVEPVARTELPLGMNHRTEVVQTVVTRFATIAVN